MYNQTKDKIETLPIQLIVVNGTTVLTSSLTEAGLNVEGYYKVEYGSRPNRRYYTYAESKLLVGNIYKVTYVAIDRPLREVKDSLLASLKDTKIIKQDGRPAVNTGLGFSVDGGYRDLQNLEAAKSLGLLFVLDTEGAQHDILASEWDLIINAVKLNGLGIIQANQTKKIAIEALLSINECILYEATPYTVQELQWENIEKTIPLLDVNNVQIELTVTKYKNNCTEWGVL